MTFDTNDSSDDEGDEGDTSNTSNDTDPLSGKTSVVLSAYGSLGVYGLHDGERRASAVALA